jgi:23S rRNA (cytidine2498-2'-O)-methyltransferase
MAAESNVRILSDETRCAFVGTCISGFEREAARELAALLPGGTARSLFLKGNVYAEAACAEAEAVRRVAETDTQLLCSLTPVRIRFGIAAAPGEPARIADTIAAHCTLPPDAVFLVRCHRRGAHPFASRDVEQAVAAELSRRTGARGDYAATPDRVVRIEIYQARAYAGWSPPGHYIHRKAQPRRRHAPGTRPVNRAEAKLREALAAFAIDTTGMRRALDLGAAPGGWTAVLSETVPEVVAVDPAAMDAQVLERPNVLHCRMKAEDYVDRPDAGTFDLAVNDMNADPEDSARVLAAAADLLQPGAPIIMTVKYTTRHRRRHREDVTAVLAERFEGFRWKRLPHNRLETTVCARRK